MAFSTLTRYLRLKIRTDLNLPASQNLARLDALGNSFNVGETDDLEIRSRGNVVLKPEDTSVGGTGSGGEVHVGTSAQPVAVKFFASSFTVAGGAGNLLTEESSNTVINKSISGSSNLLSNIGYSSLLLSGSIKGSDLASDANIPDSKLATISTAGKVNVSALTGSLSGSLLPSYTNNNGKYLSLNSGSLEWSTVAAGGVTSVNGQSGDVTLSIPDAYTDSDADSRVSAGITALKGQPSGLASLGSDGKLPTSQLPSLAITSTSVVGSQAAMLALSAEEGDVAIRTDNGKSYILAGDPTVVGDWKEVTAGGAVTSVNGQSGNVSLSTSDVSEGSNQYYTSARFDSALAAKSTTNLSEGSNQYFTAARAKSASVTVNVDDEDQTKAPSLGLLKSYAVRSSGLGKATWMGGNSFTITHGYGSKDVEWTLFDLATGEKIVIDNVTWGSGNNSFTLTLPDGIVAGQWRLLYWVR